MKAYVVKIFITWHALLHFAEKSKCWCAFKGLMECIAYPASLAMEEFRDVDFGDISKSESDLYRNDSLR